MENSETPVIQKRKLGRPKNPVAKPVDNSFELKERSATKHKMKAKPNWEEFDPSEVESPDRLHISKADIPDGMDLRWVRDSSFGQPDPQWRGRAEKAGWTPVHPSDFDGMYDGKFSKKGSEEEINIDGLVLMARPLEISRKAKIADRRRAIEQVQIKEQAWRSGDLQGVSLDTRHSTALQTNRINKSLERIEIPEDR